MTILINVLISFHVLVSMLMIGVVLMQRPKNEGLGAAFGGGMTENIFGAQTTHVLQKFTVWLGIIFFVLTLLLAIIYARRGSGETAIQKELLSQPIPAVTPAAIGTATPPVPSTTPVAAEPVKVEAGASAIHESVPAAPAVPSEAEAPAGAPSGN